MWKLLPWFWSWGNWGTSCDNVCYLIWHLWHTSDGFRRRGAAVNRLDCGTEIRRNSCLIKTWLFLNSLFFRLRRLSLCLPLTVSYVCVCGKRPQRVKREREIRVRRSIQTAWDRRRRLVNAWRALWIYLWIRPRLPLTPGVASMFASRKFSNR